MVPLVGAIPVIPVRNGTRISCQQCASFFSCQINKIQHLEFTALFWSSPFVFQFSRVFSGICEWFDTSTCGYPIWSCQSCSLLAGESCRGWCEEQGGLDTFDVGLFQGRFGGALDFNSQRPTSNTKKYQLFWKKSDPKWLVKLEVSPTNHERIIYGSKKARSQCLGMFGVSFWGPDWLDV